MHRTIIVGSPRINGRSAALANEIFQTCIEECPDDGISIVSVASTDVGPCQGCDKCKVALNKEDARYPQIPECSDPLSQVSMIFKSDACAHQCIIEDDIIEVRKHLDAAEELIVVCPVYFSGAPAQMKALLDRMQPYFWSDVRKRTNERRPLTIHVVGEGSGPHGFSALVDEVRSAFAVAGFKLERVLDWTGKIDEDGEITEDAEELEY